jgi:penicillin-binding protein 1A
LLLLASDGTPFARRGGCYDTPVAIDEVPQTFIDALLVTEDRHFYSFIGIGPVGVVRALRSNRAAGKVVQGGSTITQQLAKVSYLSPVKSVDRKIREAIGILRLELMLSKDEILERYFSRAYFGQGCFGLRAATRKYFDRAISDLTLHQLAMLVALLKPPGHLSRDRAASSERDNIVLGAMVDDGRLSFARRVELAAAKIHKRKSSTFGAYYADWLVETVSPAEDVPAGVLPVRTGFDRTLQSITGRAVRNMMHRVVKFRRAT